MNQKEQFKQNLDKENLPEHTKVLLEEAHELSSEQEAQVCQLIIDFTDTFKEPGGKMEKHQSNLQCCIIFTRSLELSDI